ncbi:MAG: hypothetical protein NWE83_07825 [Candidatus Bathyarchaeota archaeon]|jgi:hypothetical protein|nr:hypothetical protein [Candidatus Bathyarchaeota archaeon]
MIDRLLQQIMRLDPLHDCIDFSYQDRFKGESSLLFRQVPDSDTLIVFFGSMNGKIGTISPFEFLRSTAHFAAHKLYVRDFYQSYYHKGLHGYTQNIHETQTLIKTFIHKHEIENLICVGHCAGGYAAILFGSLLSAVVVHAFSPQTFLNAGQKLLHLDPSFHHYTRKMYATSTETRYFDLNHLTPNPKTQFVVHYRASVRRERIHAFHLTFNNVVRVAYDSDTTPVRILRDQGLLIDVLISDKPVEILKPVDE